MAFKSCFGVLLATPSLHFVNKMVYKDGVSNVMDKAFALQAMQWGGQRNPFAHCTLVQSARGASQGNFFVSASIGFFSVAVFCRLQGNTTERLICKIALDY